MQQPPPLPHLLEYYHPYWNFNTLRLWKNMEPLAMEFLRVHHDWIHGKAESIVLEQCRSWLIRKGLDPLAIDEHKVELMNLLSQERTKPWFRQMNQEQTRRELKMREERNAKFRRIEFGIESVFYADTLLCTTILSFLDLESILHMKHVNIEYYNTIEKYHSKFLVPSHMPLVELPIYTFCPMEHWPQQVLLPNSLCIEQKPLKENQLPAIKAYKQLCLVTGIQRQLLDDLITRYIVSVDRTKEFKLQQFSDLLRWTGLYFKALKLVPLVVLQHQPRLQSNASIGYTWIPFEICQNAILYFQPTIGSASYLSRDALPAFSTPNAYTLLITQSVADLDTVQNLVRIQDSGYPLHFIAYVNEYYLDLPKTRNNLYRFLFSSTQALFCNSNVSIVLDRLYPIDPMYTVELGDRFIERVLSVFAYNIQHLTVQEMQELKTFFDKMIGLYRIIQKHSSHRAISYSMP